MTLYIDLTSALRMESEPHVSTHAAVSSEGAGEVHVSRVSVDEPVIISFIHESSQRAARITREDSVEVSDLSPPEAWITLNTKEDAELRRDIGAFVRQLVESGP